MIEPFSRGSKKGFAMCLSLELDDPDAVLGKGEHLGFQWRVIANLSGYRCGYVRVPAGHPWHGVEMLDLGHLDVHGGVTFVEFDRPCDKPGADDAYWVGFDCAHLGDAPDKSLLPNVPQERLRKILERVEEDYVSFGATVRTQEYVEAECRSLCEQAAAATKE